MDAGPENRPGSDPADEHAARPSAPPAPPVPPRKDSPPDDPDERATDERATDERAEDRPTAEEPAGRRGPDVDRLFKKVLVWLGVAVAVVALYFLLASFLPRWWAQRMGNLVDGSFALGVWWGLFFGALFTAVPILISWQAFRRQLAWKLRLVILAVAVLVAAPNLLTLGVVLGTNNAAHAGERIFDVEGPAFRGSSLAGAIIGVVVAVGLIVLLTAYKRRGRRIRDLEHDVRSNADGAKSG